MGTRPIEWHPVAIKELADIFDYIFKESPQNAVMVYKTLLDLAENTSIYPEKYPLEPSLNIPSVRFIPKWNYKILYQIQEDKILIINIYSTRQQPNKSKP